MNLTVQSLTFAYSSGERVLENVSLSCRAGSLTVLLGANGAGKSTLLKLLGGILRPTSGDILLDDQSLSAFSDRDRACHVGMLFQTPPPPFEVTVRDFVLFGRTPRLARQEAPSPADWSDVDYALTQLELASLAGKSIRQLSGGEYQRVRLAALLALRSDILLLDEPTTAQDPRFSALLGELLQKQQTAGRTILAVTHDLAWTEKYASHTVMLKQGRVFAEGKPQKIMTHDNLWQLY